MHSSPEPRRHTTARLLTGLALAALLAIWTGIAAVRPARERLWGDEGTFVAMTESLLRDGDLLFEEPDLRWVRQRQPDQPVTVILQKTGRGISYSKPLLYPLLTAPLAALLGESGMVLTNLLLLIAAMALAARMLRPIAAPSRLLSTLLGFLVGSVLLVYVSWKMSDLALFSLTLAGLILALGGRCLTTPSGSVRLPFGGTWTAVAAGILLAGATSMRYTTAALAGAAVVALALDRRPRRALAVALATALGLLSIGALSQAALGTANPYKAVRSSFDRASGYPAGDQAAVAAQRFDQAPATQSATWQPPWQPRKTLYSSLYFLVGRHTGLLFYFPIAVPILLLLLRRPDRVALTLLGGASVVVGFYLVWMPDNYFGGSTFVGNRYLLGVLPVLLAALTRMPGSRSLAAVWLLALVAWGSALVSIRAAAGSEPSSQDHAWAGIFRLLPFESTARRIDGLNERFWADDYVRFLDPFALVSKWSFRLDSERPPTDVLVATDWPGTSLQFVVSPKAAEVELETGDWRAHDRFRLPLAPPAAPGLIEVTTSRPWRRHPFWWNRDRLYDVRVLRFTLKSLDGEPTTAVVRYAGRGRVLAPLAAELLELTPEPASVASAGSTSPLEVRLRNAGRRPWKADGLFPVRLRYRFPSLSARAPSSPPPVTVPHNVRPGEAVVVTLEVHWPEDPGVYTFLLELLREPSSRLGELGRLTLGARELQIRPATSPGIREP